MIRGSTKHSVRYCCWYHRNMVGLFVQYILGQTEPPPPSDHLLKINDNQEQVAANLQGGGGQVLLEGINTPKLFKCLHFHSTLFWDDLVSIDPFSGRKPCMKTAVLLLPLRRFHSFSFVFIPFFHTFLLFCV